MADAHLHMLIHAKWKDGAQGPHETEMNDWLTRLVEALDMNILFGPVVRYSDNPGNEGITGVVTIDTSHIAFHDWSQHDPSFFQMDVYSCKEYAPEIVIGALREFEFDEIKWWMIDRANGDFKVLERGVDTP